MDEIAAREPLVTPEVLQDLKDALVKLQNTVFALSRKLFYKHRILKTHLLPLTNIAIDNTGKV